MYIGNDLQIAHPSYKIIDDISSGFNGSTTSFALQVNGETPVPFPISTQQVMISVNGVVQEPDPSGSAGFKLLGSNIVFSSAPANGHAFFGVINAGADYVTAGSEFPDGSATAPSFTFQDDQDTGWFRSASGAVGYSANGVQKVLFDGNGVTVTGTCTATSFAGAATQVTVASESSDTTCFPLFATAATGNLAPKSGSNLTFNSSSGALTAGSFSGSGANLTGLNASNIASGTIAAARVPTLNQDTSGTAEKATRVIVTASSDTSSFPLFVQSATGNLTPHAQTNFTFNATSGVLSCTGFSGSGASLTNVNATTLNSIASGSFLRSDADDSFSGKLTSTYSSNEKIVLSGSVSPYITFQEGTSTKAYIQWNSAGYLDLQNAEDSSRIRIKDNPTFSSDGSTFYTIWHAGNDGGGSGLDADTLDTLQASSFVRNDLANSVAARVAFHANATGNYDDMATSTSSQGSIEVYNQGSGNDAFMAFHAGGDFGIYFGLDADANDLAVGGWSMGANKYKVWHAGNDGAGSGLDADTLDGHQSGSYLRSDADDTFAKHLTFTDSNQYPVDINNSHHNKLVLRGSEQPLMMFREHNTDKASIKWNANGWIELKNIEDSSQLLIRDQITFTADGSNFYPVLHTGNLGSSGVLASTTVYTSAVHDSKGDLRKIVQNSSASSAYTLVAADAAKAVTTNGYGITVPNNVFSAGDAVTIVNNSSSNITITRNISFLYLGSDGSNGGSYTLKGRTTATIYFSSANHGYISGGGLS